MRKGGFNMFLIKEKTKRSLYKNYEFQFPKHRDAEIQAYVAYKVGKDMSSKMQSTIKSMSKMIVYGFSKEENED